MFLATSNRSKRLLHLSFFQHVRAEELQQGLQDVQALLADLPAGFRLLTDLERLETMDIACATEIGLLMDVCNQKGVELVVRLVPDPKKDIGLNILSQFHYERSVRVVTCEDMTEAARLLEL